MNGRLAGSHKGGYTAFVVDISSLAQEGTNLLFVRLNNLSDAQLAPRAGENVFNGGLYRDVSLIVKDPLHVDWYGTHVITPAVSAYHATLSIETMVVNANAHDVECKLISRIEYEGALLFETAQTGVLQFGESRNFKQAREVNQPNLWHPDTPHLYTLTSQLFENDWLKDEFTTEFGIPWFHLDAKKGFFLNGSHYDILGANVHQDHAGWRDAVTHAGISRDVRLIKDCGMNFIRGSRILQQLLTRASGDECCRRKRGNLLESE